MNRSELINFCLTYPDAIEDYPFEDKNSTIMRHIGNHKWFALIIDLNQKLCVNLKCDPFQADFLRRTYKDVIPAWHMNKTHWNTVVVNGDVPKQELFEMIRLSYELTRPSIKSKK